MRGLYHYGYEKARSGPFWETKPPQIEAADHAFFPIVLAARAALEIFA
jgi:hypothetical protein